jgi:hypothetical protein
VDVFRHYTRFAGVDHQNPALPLQAAHFTESQDAHS